jgi:tight adherence protein B
MLISLVVGILVALAVGIFVYGLSRVVGSRSDLEKRIEQWARGDEDEGLSAFELDQVSSSLMSMLERTVTRQGFAERVREDLAQADLALTITEYLIVRVLLVVVLLALGYALQRSLPAIAILGAVGLFLPTVYIRSRRYRRLRAFDSQLPDVLEHLQGSLRAGYGLLQAVEWLSRQVPPPAGFEFDRVVREVQLGRSLLESLDSMVRRIPSDDLSLIVTAIKIQYEVGGGLAEILETVTHTIRERIRIMREINVLTAQQRYSGYVLMIMPIALAAYLFLTSPDYIMQLFTPGPTLCIPVGAAVLMIIGYFVMRKIVDIEV